MLNKVAIMMLELMTNTVTMTITMTNNDNNDNVDKNNDKVDDDKGKRESPRTVQTGVGPDQTPFLHFTRELPISWKPLSQRTWSANNYIGHNPYHDQRYISLPKHEQKLLLSITCPLKKLSDFLPEMPPFCIT